MEFKFLVENKTDNPGVTAEHGLSIYIKAHGHKILFDAGATDMLIANAEEMKINLSEVDTAVISHGHYDHTGGFPAFCEKNDKAKIHIHKNAFRESFGFEDGKMDEVTCGIRWTKPEMDSMRDRIVFTDGPLQLDKNICITGTVPFAKGFSPTEKFFYKSESGELIEDDMSHEQCLVIKEKSGLYIFSGCSHRGAVSALNAGKSMFPGERVAVFVAGMHLYSASAEDRNKVVEQIAAENLDKIMPVHCTGIKAICDLKTALGDRCIAATAGDCFDEC